MKTRFVIVMGVAGSGKTTVGELLAQRLGWSFYDADAFHPAENIAKMANGTPLNDADRVPWLAALNALISTSLEKKRPAVLACSALKESYRQQLLEDNDGVQFVYLKGSYDLIWSRISQRKDHYMKPQMLQSQFEALEEPANALKFDVSLSVEAIVERLLEHLE
jgi:gluconokinase